MNLKKETKYLFIIILAGLILRLLHLKFFLSSPLASTSSPDEVYHHLWALKIINGNIVPNGVFFRAPLYPYILSIFYAIFGDGNLAGRIPGLLSGILTIYLSFKLTRQLSSSKAGLIAAAFAAFNPILIYFESRLLLDFLLIPFAMLAFIFLINWLEKHKTRDMILSGLFIGLFAITRPTILPIFIVLLIYLLFRRQPKAILLILIGFVIPILPVFISNIANGSPTLIASQGGVNFYIGNNVNADGISAAMPEFGYDWQYNDAARLARAESGKKYLSNTEVSRFYYRKGIKFWTNHTSEALLLLVKKLYLSFDGIFLGNNGDISFFRKYSPILKIPNYSGLLFAIGLFVGLYSLHKRKKLTFLFSFAILYGLILAIFFVNTRFRLPLYAAFIPLSAIGISEYFKKELLKKPSQLFILCVLICLINIDLVGAKSTNNGSFYFTLGNSYLIENKLSLAEDAFKKSLIADSLKSGANLNLGLIQFKNRDFENAEIYFEKEIAINGEVAKAYSNIGLIGRLQNNPEKAINNGKLALEQSSDLRDAYYNLVTAYNHFGQSDSALKYALLGHEEYSGDIRLMFALGNSYQLRGDFDKAVGIYVKLIDDFGKGFIESYDFGSAMQNRLGFSKSDEHILSLTHFNMSVLCGNEKDIQRMKYHLLRSLKLDPDFPTARIQLGNFYLGMGQADSAQFHYEYAQNLGVDNPVLNYNMGIVLSQLHRFDEAREKFIKSAKSELTREATIPKLAVIDSIIAIRDNNKDKKIPTD